jgi:hypothetical protein
MSSKCKLSAGSSGDAPDRYKSFSGIDCAGNARRVMAYIDHHIIGLQDDKFWRYFQDRRHLTSAAHADELLLLASFVNPVRDLFESKKDAQGLALLDQLEDECF